MKKNGCIMKILHTSDWHLGHTLYNFDRTEEQRAMLDEITEIVRERKPDVFLLCGDVYHTSQPSAAVQKLFTEALVGIHDANPGMTIVVTAGNHDSGSRHEVFRTPWRALGVHAIGRLDKDNIEEHIIEVPSKGYVVAIPYCNEKSLPEGFFQEVLDAVARRNTEGLPVVLTAHTTVKGCDFSGHENASEYVVGGIDSMEVSQFGSGYDYLALGHIHRGQYVHSGHHNVRYSGTPMAVSFDENFKHSVSIIEIGKHDDVPVVDIEEISNPKPLVTLPTEGAADWTTAKRLLSEFPDDIPAYIRLNVEIDDFLPVEANAEASALTNGKQCRFCHINARRRTAGKSDGHQLSVQEFKETDPLEIAMQFAADTGIEFGDDLRQMFEEASRMVREEEK